MPSSSETTAPTIALTGATGFIGGWVMDMALNAGYRLRALTRRPQTPRDGVTWIEGTLEDSDSLKSLVKDADYAVHLAAIVKGRTWQDFYTINTAATETLGRIFAEHNPGKQFIFLSSLAAREPQLSLYARSKAEGETMLKSLSLEWTILRGPAIYGEGDREMLPLFRAMIMGFAPIPGSRNNRFALIHARDVAAAILATLGKSETYLRTFELSDGRANGYSMADIAAAVEAIENRPVRPFVIPAPIIHTLGYLGSLWAFLSRRSVMLSHHKARELLHHDWVPHNGRLDDLGLWAPQTKLAEGLKVAIARYRADGLL